MTDEPKKWTIVTLGRTSSKATEIAYSYPEASRWVGGRILQQGVNAVGHPWFFVGGLWVEDVGREGQSEKLHIKTLSGSGGRGYGYPYDECKTTIIEFANPTLARVRLYFRHVHSQKSAREYFMSDWIVVNIRRQRNKNLALGQALFEAILVWDQLPQKSGEPVEEDVFYDPILAYDTGFYGVDP
jgi:hypothetical protein